MTSPQVFLILALVSFGAALEPKPWFKPNTDPERVGNSSTRAVCSCEYLNVNGCSTSCTTAGCTLWAMRPKAGTTTCECECYCATRPYSLQDEFCNVCNVNIFSGTSCMITAYSSTNCASGPSDFCSGYGNLLTGK